MTVSFAGGRFFARSAGTGETASAAITAAGAFFLYTATSTRHVGLIDSGELAAVVMTGGIAHPTGYPFFTLLGYVWAAVVRGLHGGSGSFAALVQLSAAPAATAAGVVAYGGARLARRLGSRGVWTPLAGIAAGASLAVSATVWESATDIEVYALTLLLVSLLVVGTIEETAASRPRARRRGFYGLAYLAGLALGNHLTVIACAPLAVLAVGALPRPRRGRDLAMGLACAFLGGTILLHLPLRAACDPLLEWGDPERWGRFWAHIQGRQYQVWMFQRGPQELLAALTDHLHRLATEDTPLAPILIGLAVLGMVRRRRRPGRVPLALAGVVGLNLALALNYEIPDIRTYLLPSICVLCLGSAAGVAEIAGASSRFVRLAGSAALVAAVLGVGHRSEPLANRRNDRLVETYARTILTGVAPNAVVLLDRWDAYAPTLYLQHVKGLRPDVTVVDKELLRRSWYFEYLKRRDPALLQSIEAEVADFLEALAPFERGDPYDAARLQRDFIAINEGLLRGGESERPAYAFLLSPEGIARRWTRIPRALLFRMIPPGRPVAPLPPLPRSVVEPPGLSPSEHEARDPRSAELARDYSRFAHLRARHLLAMKEVGAAQDELTRAIRLDPTNRPAIADLARLLERRGDRDAAARLRRRLRRTDGAPTH